MLERINTVGRVGVAAYVALERITTGGRVVGAGCVAIERKLPMAVLLKPLCVAIERKITVGRVVAAGGVAQERAGPMAVLPKPVLFKSASSPRTVFALVKQPSRQAARAAGESTKQARMRAMRKNRIATSGRFIEFVVR